MACDLKTMNAFGRIYEDLHDGVVTDDVKVALTCVSDSLTEEVLKRLVLYIRTKNFKKAFNLLDGEVAQACHSAAIIKGAKQ